MKLLLIIWTMVLITGLVVGYDINATIDKNVNEDKARLNVQTLEIQETHNPQRTVNVNQLQGGL